MNYLLSLTEELNIRKEVVEPHFSFINDDLPTRKKVSLSINRRGAAELLLVDNYGFQFDFILAGLTKKQIEYIGKNAPLNYKKRILKGLKEKSTMQGIVEIVKALDTDLGNTTSQNQKRIQDIIQYIKDNKQAFQS